MNYARMILAAARRLVANADYIYDPEHKNKPKGGNWHRTKEGWSTYESGGSKDEKDTAPGKKKKKEKRPLIPDNRLEDAKKDGEKVDQKKDEAIEEAEGTPKRKEPVADNTPWGQISINRVFGEGSTVLSDIFGEDSGVELVSEQKFKMENGRSYSMKNLYKIVTGFTQKDAEKLKESEGFRTDFIVRSQKETSKLPFPIFVETDGSQHEGSGKDKHGFRYDLADRVKDYAARIHHNGVAVRLRSEDQTGEQLKFVLGELSRYNDIITNETPDIPKDERKAKIQEYADALSFGFAADDKKQGNENSTTLPVDGHPEEYIRNLQDSIMKRIEVKNMTSKTRKSHGISDDWEKEYPRMNKTEKKLLKIMSSDYHVLYKNVIDPEKQEYNVHIDRNKHASNYMFLAGIEERMRKSRYLKRKNPDIKHRRGSRE